MLSEFVNPFLANKNIGSCFFNRVHEVSNVVFFFLEEQRKLVWIGDLNLSVDFSFLDFNRRVNKCDLSA